MLIKTVIKTTHHPGMKPKQCFSKKIKLANKKKFHELYFPSYLTYGSPAITPSIDIVKELESSRRRKSKMALYFEKLRRTTAVFGYRTFFLCLWMQDLLLLHDLFLRVFKKKLISSKIKKKIASRRSSRRLPEIGKARTKKTKINFYFGKSNRDENHSSEN